MQTDLIDMSDISTTNKNIKYILTVIDIFSRFVYVEPLKDKNSTTVVYAMKKIIDRLDPVPEKNHVR